MPVRTGAAIPRLKPGVIVVGADPLPTPIAPAFRRGIVDAPDKAAAATVATLPRRGVTSPVPSGWRRLERKITYPPDDGSIHKLVPVNPVWPYEPIGNRSPRLPE